MNYIELIKNLNINDKAKTKEQYERNIFIKFFQYFSQEGFVSSQVLSLLFLSIDLE